MKDPIKSDSRRLAAIMFTDIAGYTAIMQKDEEEAIKIRRRHREVFEDNHQRFNGEIIQYYGDGTLSMFKSAIESTKCAIEIQKSLSSLKPKVPLRIGIHLGDIVYTGTEVIGDSVNVSSRIQSMGIPGSILISAKLNDELKNHKSITTVSMGQFELKNIEVPVEVFAVSNKGIAVPDPSELKGKAKKHLKSIAVLPLANISADPENEYFSDGMTEEIINALTKIQGLQVTSRTSSFYFKNKDVPVKQIGQELNVSTILEGSVRLSGNKIRITTQLISVEDDVHFWSETFDRSLDDIFAIQDEVSLIIADKLRKQVGHFEIEDHLVESPDISVEAYKKYLKSRYHILKMSEPEIEKGISILQEVIREQPDYPMAYLGLHLAYTLLGTLGFIPSGEAYAKGKSYLDQAIELDETIPECQLQLSWIAFLQDWDFEAAYAHLNNVRKVRPMVDYYQCTSTFLSAEGKLKAAMHYIDIGIQMDPFSEINYHLKALLYHMEEKYDEAIYYYEKSIELKPDAQVSLLELGQSYILSGQAEKALELFRNLYYPPDDPLMIGGLTIANAAVGNTGEAREGLKKLELLLDTEAMERAWFLLIYAHMIMGNDEKALEYLQQGLTHHFPMMLYLMRDPVLKPIRIDPKYKEIYRKVYAKSSEFQDGSNKE